MRRRSFLTGLSVLGGLSLAGAAPLAFADAQGDARFVVIVLRGAMDGLAAVPAYGDPHYAKARGPLALPRPGQDDGILDLDGTFGLHPGLAPLAPLYAAGDVAIVHAAAPPYHERSHFDAQDVLENGTDRPLGARSGWLNRALTHLQGAPPAMAVGRSVPLLLRGPARAASADPLRPARDDDALMRQVKRMYGGDAALGPALQEGLDMQAMLARHQDGKRVRGNETKRTVQVLGRILSSDEGPRVAVLEIGGWDTHSNQRGTLTRQLGALSEGLAAFKEAMSADAWDRTVILAVTEFGRTVAGNGSGGSDHGVGGAAFLVGGAVAGGRVIADWPGLAPKSLLDGRDLRPTTDLRAVFKGVLGDHLRVSSRGLDEVFPRSSGVKPMSGLLG